MNTNRPLSKLRVATVGLQVCCAFARLAIAEPVDPLTDILSSSETTVAADPLYEEMVVSRENGDLDQAYEACLRLLAKVRFARAMGMIERGLYKDAAEQLDAVLSVSPDHHRARLELAKLKFEGGEAKVAQKEFEKVLEAEPPPAVKRNIERYIDRIEKQPGRYDQAVRVTLGGFYDDNVNVGPREDTVDIAPISFLGTTFDQLRVAEQSLPAEVWGLYTYVSVAGNLDAGEKDEWVLFGQADYYQTWLDSSDEYELLYAGTSGGGRLYREGSLFELPLAFSHIQRGRKTVANTVGFQPSMVKATEKESFWITEALVENRDYIDNEDRDSIYLGIGESFRKHFENREFLAAGLDLFYEDAEALAYENFGAEIGLTGEMGLPADIRIFGRSQVRLERYLAREPLAEEEREDAELKVTLGIRREILSDASADLTYQFTRNFSTFDLYDYERNVVTVGVTKDF